MEFIFEKDNLTEKQTLERIADLFYEIQRALNDSDKVTVTVEIPSK